MYDTDLVKRHFWCQLRTRVYQSLGGHEPSNAARRQSNTMADDLDIALLTATFDAREGSEEMLLSALARYVVMTRNEPACRNVDLVASTTHRGRFLVIEKWDDADAIQLHLNSPLMTEMAREAVPVLATKPSLDLYDTISAHDLM
jgi:quinol monooxygenase YgiN